MVSRAVWPSLFAVLSLVVLLPATSGAAPPATGFVIVTRSGGQFPALGPPRIDHGVAFFRTPRGTPVAIHLHNLDVAATEKLNGVDLGVEVEDLRSEGAESHATPRAPGEPRAASDRAVAGYTITNADLKRLRTGRLFIEGGELPEFTAKEQAVQEGQVSPETLQQEMRTRWESRAKALQARKQELERREESLQGQAKDLEQSILTLGAAAAQKIGAQLDNVKEQLSSVQKELETVNSSWRSLQEEAHKAGVPPEWLR